MGTERPSDVDVDGDVGAPLDADRRAGGDDPPSFDDAVAAVLLQLPAGEIVTYGEVAAEAGYPGAARAVGRLLATSGGAFPWWRVVNAAGRLVPGHEAEHARRLVAEGVPVADGRVRMSRRR